LVMARTPASTPVQAALGMLVMALIAELRIV
jgi:hypothetical protein